MRFLKIEKKSQIEHWLKQINRFIPDATSGISKGLPWSRILSNSSKLVSVISSLRGVVFAINLVSHILGKLLLSRDLNSYRVSGSGATNWFIIKQRSRSILWPTTVFFDDEILLITFVNPDAFSNSFSSRWFFSFIYMGKIKNNQCSCCPEKNGSRYGFISGLHL